jgi:hypothetical protein
VSAQNRSRVRTLAIPAREEENTGRARPRHHLQSGGCGGAPAGKGAESARRAPYSPLRSFRAVSSRSWLLWPAW